MVWLPSAGHHLSLCDETIDNYVDITPLSFVQTHSVVHFCHQMLGLNGSKVETGGWLRGFDLDVPAFCILETR